VIEKSTGQGNANVRVRWKAAYRTALAKSEVGNCGKATSTYTEGVC